MFSLIKTLFKIGLIAAIALVVGHWVEWKGESISEHAKEASEVIQTQASSAREWIEDAEIPRKAEEKASEVIHRINDRLLSDAPEDEHRDLESSDVRRKDRPHPSSASRDGSTRSPHDSAHTDQIEDSERAKLRSLIRDLNR